MTPTLALRQSDGTTQVLALPLAFCVLDGIVIADAKWCPVIYLNDLPKGAWLSGHPVDAEDAAANALFVILRRADGHWIARPGQVPFALNRIVAPGTSSSVATPWEMVLVDANDPTHTVERWGALTETEAGALLAARQRDWSAEGGPWRKAPMGHVQRAPGAPIETLLAAIEAEAARTGAA